jgi:hypothetical protein
MILVESQELCVYLVQGRGQTNTCHHNTGLDNGEVSLVVHIGQVYV